MAEIEVILRGSALRIGDRVVRRCDLDPVLGRCSGAETPRFASAHRDGERIAITFADGATESVPLPTAPDRRRAELIVRGIGQLLTAEPTDSDPLGLVRDAAIVAGGGTVLWVGPETELDGCGLDLGGASAIDVGGSLVTPGLIDCHAHPLFAGNRADEFARRARGEGYLEIQAAGGGIGATLGPTRSASFEEHVALTSARASRALAWGTTTLEAKSGYDLTLEGELRLLQVARTVDALQPVDLVPTLLGAHLIPPEFADDREGYVRLVAQEMVPRAAAAGVRSVDVYCDQNAFTLEETRTVLTAARDVGLLLRAHIGQFADLGGAELLAELGALSGDHLEQVSAAGIRAMAAQSVVAVMLPGACVQLKMAPPPVAAMREAGVALALASDLNPGTAHSETLPVPMWLATTHYGMTVEEAWLGVTRNAARALGRADIGFIGPGAKADLVVWDAELPAEIPYHFAVNLVRTVVTAGRVAIDR